MKDHTYTNGVIAVKEKSLLREKLLRFAELSAEDAFRALLESGFGSGAEAESIYEFEKLVARDEKETDDFIREYAPDKASLAYFFSERDFHNAKAMLKAQYLLSDAEKMLAPAGLIPVPELLAAIRGEDYAALGEELGKAAERVAALFAGAREAGTAVSGAEVGAIFEKALHAHLTKVCRGNGFLKKMLRDKADKQNILTAFRSETAEQAERFYFEGGKISFRTLSKLFTADGEKRERALAESGQEAFARLCFEAEREGKPFASAEKALASCETDYFTERRFELKNSQPFLYYVFRRRKENENVRILFVCLLAGMKENEIKNRLRGV